MSFDHDVKIAVLGSAGTVPLHQTNDDHVGELQLKQTKKGERAQKCRQDQTSTPKDQVTKQLETEVRKGTGHRCSPCKNSADVELSYQHHGWERTICATDFKFRWQRSDEKNCLPESNGFDHIAYVRKVEFCDGGDNEEVRLGRVSLVAPGESVAGSVVTCANGCMTASLTDIENAQKMTLENKFTWFRQACNRLCNRDEERARINIRHDHLVADSIEAVMSFDRTELRKEWIIEREEERGELKTHDWYESVFERLFCPDAGLWQKCDMDETRMEINFLSDMLCPDHLRYFRFIGRVLGKALLDQQVVNCRLAGHIYKLLLGWPIVPNDLKDKDLCYLKSLEEMGAEVINLGLHFTVSEDRLGLRTRVPILPGGFEIAVDGQKLPEYIDSCFKYHIFGRCKNQLNEFILGFFEVVPDSLLSVFDFQELEELMCGSYTGGKTEEEPIDESKQRQASVEEIMNNIFNVPELQPGRSMANRKPESGRGIKSENHARLPRQKSPWNYPQEEKVEEEPPQDWNYPISSFLDISDEDDQEALVDIPAPGYLDANYREDESLPVRGAQAVNAGNPLEARIQEKQRVDAALPRRDSNRSRVASSTLDGSAHENANTSRPHLPPTPMDALVTLAPLRTESSSSTLSPIPVPNALLVEDETLYLAEPLDTVSSNKEGYAQDAKERRLRIKSGCCPDCGMQTHKLAGVLGKFKKRYRPLSNEHVLNGRCLMCNPSDVNKDDRPHPSAPPFDMALDSHTEENQPKRCQDVHVENKYFSRAQSHVEVEHWLLTRLPNLQRQDVENYCNSFAKDGFDSLDMLEGVEEGDLHFMKKAHRRALLKRL